MTYTTIISVQQLQQLLEQSTSPNTVVLDARFKLDDTQYGQRAYDTGHIPGAHYVHLDRDLSSPITPQTGRHPLPDSESFAHTMRRLGVSDRTQVVVYDDANGMFASRAWWLLKWIGHDNVAVLDGGWAAWQRAGGGTSCDVPPLPASGSLTARTNAQLVLSADDVQRGLADQSIVLCDARAAARYRGEVEPIDPVAGHIPGAINVPFEQNLNSDGTFKSSAELHALHQRNGDIVHMCGSGVTACHNLLAATIAGLPLLKLYAGSWSEWIRDPSRPVHGVRQAQPPL